MPDFAAKSFDNSFDVINSPFSYESLPNSLALLVLIMHLLLVLSNLKAPSLIVILALKSSFSIANEMYDCLVMKLAGGGGLFKITVN